MFFNAPIRVVRRPIEKYRHMYIFRLLLRGKSRAGTPNIIRAKELKLMLYAEIVKSLYDGLKHNHYDEWVIKDDGIVISQPMLWKTEFMLWKTEPKKVDMSEIVLDHFRKSAIGCVFIGAGLVLLCSCAKVEKYKSYGNPHTIKQYSGGVLVNEWVSKGKVLSEVDSDGYYFFTKDNSFIEASGTLVIKRHKGED